MDQIYTTIYICKRTIDRTETKQCNSISDQGISDSVKTISDGVAHMGGVRLSFLSLTDSPGLAEYFLVISARVRWRVAPFNIVTNKAEIFNKFSTK